MFQWFNASRIAAASAFLAMVIGGPVVANALGVDQERSEASLSLLPQDVVGIALSEADSPPDYTIIPETNGPTPERAVALRAVVNAADLNALVSANLSSTADNAEERCLASAIYFEAKSESFEGQLAVAQVVINRANSGRFASSICGVVLQRSQFSFVRGGAIPSVNNQERAWREAMGIARIAKAKLYSSRAPGALYFHAARVAPNWKLNRVASIGNHIFYK